MRLGADLKTLVMKITEKENLLLRRALDPASSPNEAEAAMAAFARSLRRRGISGYDFVPPDREAQPAGPQARPSDTPQPPPEPPKAEPPPPYQRNYEQAERAYKEAAATDPVRPEVQPTKNNSGRVLGCFFTIVSWLLIGAISSQCRHNDTHKTAIASPTPAIGTPANPYRFLNWKDYTDYNSLPFYSYYIDPQGRIRQKLPPPPADHVELTGPGPTPTPTEPTQTEKDANWQRILDMRAANVDGSATPAPTPYSNPRGSRTNPYRIDWQKSSCFKLWEAVPQGRYYIDSHGQLIRKAPNPTRPGLSHPGDHQPII